jgi:hypothetical protein
VINEYPEAVMSTLHQHITEKFLSKLTESDDVDLVTVDKLRTLFSENKKVKPEDFIKIFTLPLGEDVK